MTHATRASTLSRPPPPPPPPPPPAAPVSPIYPRRYFDLSPVWFRWNRLTARDVHALRLEPGFEGQQIFFYQNHPIRFVRVVGVVVEIESFAAGKYTIVHLDDGSGECLAVRITRIASGEQVQYHQQQQQQQPQSKHARRDYTVERVEQDSNATTVANVKITMRFGLPTIFVDEVQIDVGSILRVKGTITIWREVKQLDMKLVAVAKDTREESASWVDTAKWKRDFLMAPWILTDAAMAAYDERLRKEQAEAVELANAKKERRRVLREKRAQYEHAHELRRKKEEKAMNEGALAGADCIRDPWD